MSRFWALLKMLLINYFGISALQIKDKKNRVKYLKKLGVGIILVAALAPTVYLYTWLLIQGFELLAPVGQEGAIITLGLVMVSSIVFFFGIFYVINFFYFAADTQNLLALPLRGWEVLGARFAVILCYEYLTELPFLLPPLLVYGIKSGSSLVYWVFALIGYLLTPLLPLSLASIPTVVVMRFANLSRRKDLFKILGSLLVIALAIGYQFLFQKSGSNSMDPVFIQNLLSDRNGLMNLISRIFPSTRYLGLALVNAGSAVGVMHLLQFAGLSLLAVVLAWLVGEKLYFQGLVGSGETTTRRKELEGKDYKRLGKGAPATLSYLSKEIRLLLRTPPYFINCVVTNLLVPVLLAVPFLLQSHKQNSPIPWEGLMARPQSQIVFMAAIIGLVMFLAGSNAITATSLSREGKEFFISKYIPLPYKKQIQAKLLSAYVFGALGAVLLIIAARILIPLTISLISILVLVSLVAMAPVIEFGLLIDILRPKQEWVNEQQAVKQNLNVVFSMLFALLLGGAILYMVIRFIHSPFLAAGFMLLCFGLAALTLYYLLMTWGIERYQNLEG
ncbi:MAG TPA: hypothetical protein VN426_06575 [Syntrophomonadaceae bacterium]|nr:hypothetical protein [Syntrophomonadaceae bacterium]